VGTRLGKEVRGEINLKDLRSKAKVWTKKTKEKCFHPPMNMRERVRFVIGEVPLLAFIFQRCGPL